MRGKKMDNHQLFDCFTAQILGKLYESFPKKQDFWINDFDISFCIDPKERIPNEDDEEILEGTFLFLEENGILCFDKESGYSMGRYSAFIQTGLTLKGLKLLDKTPQSMVQEETIGEKIIKTLKTQGSRAAGNLLEKGLWGLLS